MKREEAIAMLRDGEEGVKRWNELRSAGEEIPDLNGADFAGADLNRADLIEANLREADLSEAALSLAIFNRANLHRANLHCASLLGVGAHFSSADLSDADLGGADLSNANLINANLHRASLVRTNLSGANLRDADLSSATLRSANLSDANLNGANLQRAMIVHTEFGNVDLAAVAGLEEVDHWGPSSIGTDTLYMSRGKIPEVFLRGCGVPDALIEYLPALLGAKQAIEFYSCFISYSHQDERFCKRLHSRMRDEHLRVWYAPEDMKAGRKGWASPGSGLVFGRASPGGGLRRGQAWFSVFAAVSWLA